MCSCFQNCDNSLKFHNKHLHPHTLPNNLILFTLNQNKPDAFNPSSLFRVPHVPFISLFADPSVKPVQFSKYKTTTTFGSIRAEYSDQYDASRPVTVTSAAPTWYCGIRSRRRRRRRWRWQRPGNMPGWLAICKRETGNCIITRGWRRGCRIAEK